MESWSFTNTAVESSLNWKHFLVGVAVAAFIAVLLYFVVDRADTRPVVDGFTTAALIEQTYADAPKAPVSEAQTQLDVLMKKLAVFKSDLLSGRGKISQIEYNAHQDIRPLADWTAQCYSKNVPERDITLQLEKWFESGKHTIMELGLGSQEANKIAELSATIEDVGRVAMDQCVATAHSDIDGVMGLHAPMPYSPADSGLVCGA